MVWRDYCVCFRNFDKRLKVLGILGKKSLVLVIIRRYVRKYYTQEISGGSYIEQKESLCATRMTISIVKSCSVRMTNTGY